MKNVIFVDFVNKVRIEQGEAAQVEQAPQGKRKPAKRIGKGEIFKISKRIAEINGELNLCDPDRDFDVIENLERELSQLDAKLAEAM